jgi:transcriptional regulator with XRE-family HTH domain
MANKLERLREHLGFNKNRFAEFLGVSNVYITRYEKGEYEPSSEFYRLLKKKIPSLNLNWLIGDKGNMMDEYKSVYGGNKPNAAGIPLLSTVACGVPYAEFTQNYERIIEIDGLKGLVNPFAVIAQGLSMAQTIMPGDILICYEPSAPIKNNSLVLVSYKTEPDTTMGLIKRVQFTKEGYIFYSDNSRNFPPMHAKKEQVYKLFAVYNKMIRNLK